MYLLSAINSDKSFICEHYNIDTRKNPVKYIKNQIYYENIWVQCTKTIGYVTENGVNSNKNLFMK